MYAHDDLRVALERLFNGKCAYCESSIKSCDWDVEHFRPKGSVAECPGHPGYYWLAYEWSNLYPACVLCNRRRHERPLWGDAEALEVGGKADQFPLRDESRRAMDHDASLGDEEPLLLDPCHDDPETCLTFAPNGAAIAVDNDERAAKTIEVLFLYRKRLRDARKRVIERVARALGGNLLAPADLDAWLRRHFLDAACEYARAARAVIRDPAAFGL